MASPRLCCSLTLRSKMALVVVGGALVASPAGPPKPHHRGRLAEDWDQAVAEAAHKDWDQAGVGVEASSFL